LFLRDALHVTRIDCGPQWRVGSCGGRRKEQEEQYLQ
jgi:hypothetical protein